MDHTRCIPTTFISTILEHLQGKELFSKFDIWWGYENIHIHKEDQWKAAFETPLGLFQPCVIFFGLMNSPATFCCAIAHMFWPLTNKFPTELFVYMDDILIAIKDDIPCHWEIVHVVLDLSTKESYFLRPSKFVFEQKHIEYLRVIVDGSKLSIDPAKAESIRSNSQFKSEWNVWVWIMTPDGGRDMGSPEVVELLAGVCPPPAVAVEPADPGAPEVFAELAGSDMMTKGLRDMWQW